MKFKTHYNSEPEKGEINIKPSMAIPDMSLTIQEMIKRHTRGIPLSGNTMMEFTGEDDPLQGVNIKSLDLEELDALGRSIRERYNLARDKFISEAKIAKKKQVMDEIKAEQIKEQEKFAAIKPAVFAGGEAKTL